MEFHSGLEFLTNIENNLKTSLASLEVQVVQHKQDLGEISAIKQLLITSAAASNIVANPRNYAMAAGSVAGPSKGNNYQDHVVRSHAVLQEPPQEYQAMLRTSKQAICEEKFQLKAATIPNTLQRFDSCSPLT